MDRSDISNSLMLSQANNDNVVRYSSSDNSQVLSLVQLAKQELCVGNFVGVGDDRFQMSVDRSPHLKCR